MSRTLSLILAAICGLGSALQARINGELGHRLNNGVVAATISFAVGVTLLAVIVLLSPRARQGFAHIRTARHDGTLRRVYLLGGLAGAFFVACQGITITTLGVAIFTVAFVAGQLTSSLVVDLLGITPGIPRPVTAQRLISVAIGLIAVCIAVADELSHPTGVGFVVLTAVAGACVSWQIAVNGRVKVAADNVYTAAFISFLVGAVALTIVSTIVVAFRGLPDALPSEPWLYIGGILGAIFVAVAARIVQIIGVLLLGLAIIAGQLVGAIILDTVVPTSEQHLTIFAILGAITAFIAVWVGARTGKAAISKS